MISLSTGFLVGFVALIKGADWFVAGISSLINPVTVNAASLCDIIILTFVSIIVFIFSLTRNTIERKEGLVMIFIYVADMIFAIMR